MTPSSSIAPHSSQPASGSKSESTLLGANYGPLEGEEITGRAAVVLKHAEAITYEKTLMVNPFPEPIPLTFWTIESWKEAEKIMGGPEHQSAQARNLVRASWSLLKALLMEKLWEYHSRIRSHYLSDIKKAFLPLYRLEVLKEDPKAMGARVQYLLEHNRFLCPEDTYEVSIDLLRNEKSLR